MADQAASTDLIVVLPTVPSVATFTDEKEFDKLYDAILKKVEEHKPDLTTKAGRDAIKSLAHKIAKTKVALDKQGLALTGEWRENTKKVNATRTKIEERLEKLQASVRKPLTDWETAEQARVDKHQAALDALLAMISISPGQPSELLRTALSTVEDTIVDASWEEFEDRAAIAKSDAAAALTRLIATAEKQEADARELEELRAVKAKLEQEKAEIAAAEEVKRLEAERVEKDRLAEEQRKAEIEQAAKDAAEKAARDSAQRIADAERRAEEAKVQAAREIEEAKAEADRKAEAERQRIAKAREDEEAEQRRRDADKAHRKQVNNIIVAELVECSGITTEQAQAIVGHLVRGLVPNVTLQY